MSQFDPTESLTFYTAKESPWSFRDSEQVVKLLKRSSINHNDMSNIWKRLSKTVTPLWDERDVGLLSSYKEDDLTNFVGEEYSLELLEFLACSTQREIDLILIVKWILLQSSNKWLWNVSIVKLFTIIIEQSNRNKNILDLILNRLKKGPDVHCAKNSPIYSLVKKFSKKV